ncbi:hypothetical protein CFK38_04570 [Brachybacterium vulturis]|uniref:Uncharacterized protein n=1 Tax=Brachybacterium vulturis TaxID=2017484 RepID=A0A291GKK5_9MICO|nr:hypothetical protein [Brachybacterium vulturis]ATG50879.1 hypothetical protein CFK38_04570 [Brachybacterium vulturis]
MAQFRCALYGTSLEAGMGARTVLLSGTVREDIVPSEVPALVEAMRRLVAEYAPRAIVSRAEEPTLPLSDATGQRRRSRSW